MVELANVEATAPFDGEAARFFTVLEGGHRRLEIARVGKTIGADRPAVRHGELATIVLAHVAARRALQQIDLELHAARDDADLPRCDLDAPEFGEEAELAQ